MACENCKYWKASYAAYIKKFVMECTNPDKKNIGGGCKFFQRKEEKKNG